MRPPVARSAAPVAPPGLSTPWKRLTMTASASTAVMLSRMTEIFISGQILLQMAGHRGDEPAGAHPFQGVDDDAALREGAPLGQRAGHDHARQSRGPRGRCPVRG